MGTFSHLTKVTISGIFKQRNWRDLYGNSPKVWLRQRRQYNGRTFLQQFNNRISSAQNLNITKLTLNASLPCRFIHTSPIRSAPPLLILAAKAIAKFAAILTGRGFRKWWKSLPQNKQTHFLQEMKRHRYKTFGAITLSSILLFLYYESHVKTAPLSNRKRFIAFTQSQFDEIAEFEYQIQFETFKPHMLPSNHPHYARVSKVIQKLLKPLEGLEEVKNKRWSIAIVGTPEENAFVLPRGQIFVFEGILKACINDDQLAVILAHEISHCILEHSAENLSFAHLLDFAIIAIIAGLWAFLPSDSIALVSQWFFHKVVSILLDLPFSRKLETEADEVGLVLLAKACFDVRESSAFWAKMSLKNNVGVEWLSTHPTNESRSAHLDSLMDTAVDVRKSCGCGDLSKTDPRSIIEKLAQLIEAERSLTTMVPVSVTKLDK